MNKKTLTLTILTIILLVLAVCGVAHLLKAIFTLIAELFFIATLGGV